MDQIWARIVKATIVQTITVNWMRRWSYLQMKKVFYVWKIDLQIVRYVMMKGIRSYFEVVVFVILRR